MTSAQNASVRKYRAEGQTLLLLFLWKGSLYKNVLKQILLWLLVYYSLNMVYRFALYDDQRRYFERFVTDIDRGTEFIPLSFVLGFYVNLIVNRYWNMWNNLPRPEHLALRIASSITGHDDKDRQMRRTAVRQILLAQVLTYRRISPPVQERYPTLDSLVETGLLNEEEKGLLEGIVAGDDASDNPAPPYWAPLMWVATLFETARNEDRVKNDLALSQLLSDLAAFRGACSRTLQVEQIGVPLAYSQVVILACYTFWSGSLMGRQWVDNTEISEENYFPLFTLLQLLVYFGWLCVAEDMIHPFGKDDDDFQLVSIIENHINVTYKMIDMNDSSKPTLVEDEKWDKLRRNTSPLSALGDSGSKNKGFPAEKQVLTSAHGAASDLQHRKVNLENASQAW